MQEHTLATETTVHVTSHYAELETESFARCHGSASSPTLSRTKLRHFILTGFHISHEMFQKYYLNSEKVLFLASLCISFIAITIMTDNMEGWGIM